MATSPANLLGDPPADSAHDTFDEILAQRHDVKVFVNAVRSRDWRRKPDSILAFTRQLMNAGGPIDRLLECVFGVASDLGDGMLEEAFRIVVARNASPAAWRSCGAVELRAGGLQAAEARFKQGILRFPDDFWLHMAFATAPASVGDYETAFCRVAALTGGFPDRHEHLIRAAEYAARLYNWHIAVGLLTKAVNADERMARLFGSRLTYYQACKAAQETRSEKADWDSCFIISLDTDTDRFASTKARVERAGLGMTKVRAVPAVTLPHLLTDHASRNRGLKPSMIGCAASHLAILETVVAKKLPFALVLEDDAVPLRELPRSVGSLGIREDFDVCWINDRMSVHWDRVGAEHAAPAVLTVSQVLPQRPDSQRGIGTDGLIYSLAGARRILDLYARDGILGHIDWQLLAYSTRAADLAALKQGSTLHAILSRYKKAVPDDAELKALAIWPPLITEDRTFDSSRHREDSSVQ